jgi:hydrophobe/amphiphile efflux-3 (HAE3) family protein
METDLDEYMPQEHPAFVYSNKAEKWFDIKDAVIIAVENPASIYQTSTLKKIKDITRKIQKMNQINKHDVTSLYTADNIIGTEEGLDVKPFFKTVPKTEEEIQELKQNVRSNEMIFKRLVSENENVTIIAAKIDDNVFSQEFYHSILNLAKSYEGPEKIYVGGTPIVEGTLAYLGPKDMKRMVPIVILVIVLVLLWVTRSVKNSAFTLLVVLFSTVWTFGLMAAFSIPIYSVSTMIPVMLIAIGVADGIHMISHLELFLKNNPGATRKEAVLDMVREMWKPVVMTSVTTAIGFISLLTSEVYPIKYFGLFTAFGVIMAMVFSLVLLPSAILVFGLPSRKSVANQEIQKESRFAANFSKTIVKHKKSTLILTLLIAGLSVFGISRVWINSSFLEKFEEDSQVVQTDRFLNRHFGGTTTLNVILQSKENQKFKNPETLKLIDSVQAEAEKLSVAGNSFSLSDYLKRMNKVMHADREKYNTIPESRNLVAQYLLLYEMSGDPENLWEVVNPAYTKANLSIQMKGDDSRTIKKVISVVERYRDHFARLGIDINYAGSGYKALVFTDLILEGQIKSLVLSIFIIIGLLAFMFRKILAGLIGAVPIIITALIGFGVMGILNIPLSTTTALISSIAVGIGIDYAVHFLERYRIYAMETGDKLLTTRLTMHHSGRAILFNAAVVIAGFLVLLFSVFPPNRALGALVSLNMFTSFLGTVTIMYLLLFFSNLFFKTKKPGGSQ